MPKAVKGPDGAIADRQKLPPGKKVAPAHRVRELTGRRTSSSRFWRMSDGTTQAEVSAVPTSYQASGGSWKAIDPAVGVSPRKDFRLANTSNLAKTYFGGSGGELVRFEADPAHAVSLSLEGAAKGAKPVAKGDTVAYAGLLPGVDATYRVGAGAVKEDLVLAERPAPATSYVFDLDTQGLTPRQQADGSIALYGDSETGRPV